MEELDNTQEVKIEEFFLLQEEVSKIETDTQTELPRVAVYGDNDVAIGIVKESTLVINVGNNSDDDDDDDTTYPCPECHTLLDASKYGKIVCPTCTKVLIRRNPTLNVYEFLTVEGEDINGYKKLIAHINNKIIDGKYDLAYQYCLKAETLAPGEPWMPGRQLSTK